MSSNLIDETIFFSYNKDPPKLIIDFVSNLELLAEKSELKLRKKFQHNGSAVDEPLKKIFDQLSDQGGKKFFFHAANFTTKRNELKTRKKQLCQQNSCKFRKVNLII